MYSIIKYYTSFNPFGVITNTIRLTPHNFLLKSHGIILANRYRKEILFLKVLYDGQMELKNSSCIHNQQPGALIRSIR